jgi:glutamyl-tRNA(Gln) amidotransferase subunit E
MDYAKLGFKAGIEIHQELNTGKLFCNCSSSMEEEELVSETVRKLRAAAGETGKVDSAAAYEQLRDRNFVYLSFKNEACLLELDEEPPLPVNKEAFDIALGFAKLTRLKVPDTICVMRKTVSDGSAVSGFQRTMLIGIESKDSYIETSLGKVKINQLNLEEDSGKIIKKEGNKIYYSLSRLGIPLLEIGTDASIKNPEHVKEVALELGTLLRSFNVRRGIGTIRQDVNVSIRGGARIEVKGWQDLRKLEELVKNEVLRQYNLLEIKNELEKRGLKKFTKNSKEVTSVFEKTHSKILSGIIKDNGKVYALALPRFAGLLKRELCPGKTFGRELSEYAKAYGTKGMIHTDEDLAKYKLEKEFDILKKELDAGKEDLIIVISEKEQIARKAADAVYDRALYCLKGVPEETRIPNHFDATSSYARPLPGTHRLYPETDVPLIEISKKKIASVKIPELVTDKVERYSREYKIEEGMAKEIIREGFDYESYVRNYENTEPSLIARILITIPKEVKRKLGKEIDIEKHADDILKRIDKGEINKDSVYDILALIAEGKEADYSRFSMLTEVMLEKKIKEIVEQNKGAAFNAVIGKVMEQLRGKAEGKKIVEITRRLHQG